MLFAWRRLSLWGRWLTRSLFLWVRRIFLNLLRILGNFTWWSGISFRSCWVRGSSICSGGACFTGVGWCIFSLWCCLSRCSFISLATRGRRLRTWWWWWVRRASRGCRLRTWWGRVFRNSRLWLSFVCWRWSRLFRYRVGRLLSCCWTRALSTRFLFLLRGCTWSRRLTLLLSTCA